MSRNRRIYAEAEVEIDVPFHDVDMMEIAWHGHYAKYLEVARTALLQGIDYDVMEMRASGYGWPVIELHIRYARPLRYLQRITVTAQIVEIEHRLKINYQIRDTQSGERLTRAHTVQVALDMASMEMQFASPPCLTERFS